VRSCGGCRRVTAGEGEEKGDRASLCRLELLEGLNREESIVLSGVDWLGKCAVMHRAGTEG
jgi:hypothetical protein